MFRHDIPDPFDQLRPRCRRAAGPRPLAFTLLEILIVVVIVVLLIIIAIPGFRRARQRNDQLACQENLVRIDSAKATWALDNDMTGNPTPTWDDLIKPGEKGYLEKRPVCPLDPNQDGSTYSINPLSAPPACSQGVGDFSHIFPVSGIGAAEGGS